MFGVIKYEFELTGMEPGSSSSIAHSANTLQASSSVIVLGLQQCRLQARPLSVTDC